MSFRKNGKKLKLVRLPDNHGSVVVVAPKKGTNTLYWWNKGDDAIGWYVKADLYDVDCENLEGLIDDTFLSLKNRLKNDYGFDL